MVSFVVVVVVGLSEGAGSNYTCSPQLIFRPYSVTLGKMQKKNIFIQITAYCW